jgi:DNA-binding NtrC family response regulator
MPESLIDSELFGHVEGAFTGATRRKEGLFRHANGGTLLLDELGNLPSEAQSRLLRVLQNGIVRPVGGEQEQEVDVRVIAATSTPLDAAVEQGKFREDLLYRLDVIRLIIPPLRERTEDVVFLFGHFLQELSGEYRCDRPKVTDGFLNALMMYDWPGNVRELENFAERLIITHSGRRVGADQFRKLTRNYRGRSGAQVASAPAMRRSPAGDVMSVAPGFDPQRSLEEITGALRSDAERAYLEGLLEHTEGRIAVAAAKAGISRRTLHRKLERHGIDKRRYRT